jgi:hypothetical protein
LAGEAVSVDSPARVSGIRRGDELLVLAADYFGRTDGTIKLRLSVPAAAVVRDLLTGQVVVEKIPAGDSAVAIDLAGQRGRLLHVSPIR